MPLVTAICNRSDATFGVCVPVAKGNPLCCLRCVVGFAGFCTGLVVLFAFSSPSSLLPVFSLSSAQPRLAPSCTLTLTLKKVPWLNQPRRPSSSQTATFSTKMTRPQRLSKLVRCFSCCGVCSAGLASEPFAYCFVLFCFLHTPTLAQAMASSNKMA